MSSQEQPQIHQLASPSHLRFHQAVGLGPTSAPSVTRTRWTRSSTPAVTCVCATPAASNSRRCPTPAVPSAEGRSKTLSRPTGARKGTTAHQRTASLRTAKSQSQGKKCLHSGNMNSGTLIWYFHTIIVSWFTRITFSKAGTTSLGKSLVTASLQRQGAGSGRKFLWEL